MQLSQLSSKPQLVQLTLDLPSLVEKYGEPLEFYTWDRQPLEVFMQLVSMDKNQMESMFALVKDLILDQSGKPIISDGNSLPTDVTIAAIEAVTNHLGKS